jgi:hypothetical protein
MLCRNRKERQKNFNKARKTGVDKDTILMYDVTTQTLEPRPIAKVYGDTNLYRDDRNAETSITLSRGSLDSRTTLHEPFEISIP